MLKETKETIGFFVTVLSLVTFQLGDGAGPRGPPGYVYCIEYLSTCHRIASDANYLTICSLFVALATSCLEESAFA